MDPGLVAETIDELTIHYEEDGKVLRKEVAKEHDVVEDAKRLFAYLGVDLPHGGRTNARPHFSTGNDHAPLPLHRRK